MTRIMLADDNAVVRSCLACLLDLQEDLDVVGEADNGAAAVLLARRLHPDVIVMDVDMPRMNGVDATRAIRRADASSHVIGFSSNEDDEMVFSMLDAGAESYVAKGGDISLLLKAIRKSVGTKIPA